MATHSYNTPIYQAYGISFVCDFALPELLTISNSGKSADVSIELGSPVSPEVISEAIHADSPTESRLKFEADRAMLFFPTVARFTVSHGSHVLVEPVEGRGPSSWRLPLLGSVLAILLEQRGLFVLHAGALDMGGFAAAFLGQKGQGKSTLNAALAVAGYPLLSDDVVALQWSDSPLTQEERCPRVLSGFGQIKLVPDAVEAVLNEEPTNWPAVAPELVQAKKRAFTAPLSPVALPLRHLFILESLSQTETPVSGDETDEGVRLRPLPPQEAFARLLPHTYGARFGDSYLKNELKKTHFSACARLVRDCQVWELARQRDLTLLPSTIETIARLTGATPLADISAARSA